MSRQRQHLWRILIFGLIGIGLIQILLARPSSVLIPLIIGATIYYLYRFPPKWLIRMGYPGHPVIKQKRKRWAREHAARRRRRNFRVIDGNKKGPIRNTKTQ